MAKQRKVIGTPDLTLQQRAQIEYERRVRSRSGRLFTYDDFKRKYRDDPVGFARDCIKWREDEDGLAQYQANALNKLVKERRHSMRGPHGLGKTMVSSIAILWFALTRDGEDWKIPTTASAWRQLEKFLWPEIHKWERRLDWDKIGRKPFDKRNELMTLSMRLESGEAFALASSDHNLIEGAHADQILYLFDESKSIPEPTWDAAEGAFSIGDCYWLAISTPGDPNGRFYDIQRQKSGYDDWSVQHVTREEAIAAKRMSVEWAEQRQKQWGKHSAVYQNRVEGNFASSDKDTVIPLEAVERSNERWLEWQERGYGALVEKIGVDVGRGTDPSAIAYRSDNVILAIEEISNDDVDELKGIVEAKLKHNKILKAIIDLTGMGAGVHDPLKNIEEIGDRVIAFVAAQKTDLTERNGERGFADARSAIWWIGREMLLNDELDLPPNDDLLGELTAPKYKDGVKIKVESKEQLRKADRLGHSTNLADAVLQTLWEDDVGSWAEFENVGTVPNYVSPWR